MLKQRKVSFSEKAPPTYEADDGPLTVEDIARICKAAQPMLPEGNVLGKCSSLDGLANDKR